MRSCDIRAGVGDLHQVTIRFSQGQWRAIQEAAAVDGVRPTDYVRDSSFARAMFNAGIRSDPRGVALMALGDRIMEMSPEEKDAMTREILDLLRAALAR